MALLSLEHVTRRFGGVVAVDDVSLAVESGQIAGLIGPNGAGKTTLFNLITRLYRPDSGEIAFGGKSLLGTPPHRIVRRGIARTFQNVELFPTMTVLENVLVGRPRAGRATRARPARRARPRSRRATPGGRPSVRDDEAGRARAGARLGAAPAPPRRAGRRPQSRGSRGARDADSPDPPLIRPDRAARRAPHEPRHGASPTGCTSSISAARSRRARRQRSSVTPS